MGSARGVLLTRGMRTTLVLLLTVAACGDDGATALPDAGPMPDAAALYCSDPPPDPLRQGAHVVYVNTEGITLTKMGDCSDSKTNCTSLIKDDTAVVPQFLPNTLGREDFIANILRLARVRLAPYSIELVTERPAAGNYYMIVIGGDAGVLVGSPGILSVSPGVCTPSNPNLVDLVFDHHFIGGAEVYASSILSDLGAMYGLGLTDTPGDCMCRVAGCGFPGVCTFSSMVPVVPGGAECNRAPIQDEKSWLKGVLGCR